jgi:hypothetical protein
MIRRMLMLALGAAALVVAAGSTVAAATAESFQVKNTQDLVDLCAVQGNDPVRVQAIHFCEGYLTGVYHYHQALTRGRGQAPVFCPTGALPTRDQAVAMFVAWAQSNQQYMDEPAIDSLFRWAVETWPCPRGAARRTSR